ncbi:MAG: type II secretion system protein, partial [Candidatus Binatia bacterium]
DKGFTLIEIIVILAVISILVAILTPTVLKFIDDAQRSSAENSVQVIAATINDLIKDTGKFPGSKTNKTFLCSANGDFATDSTSSWASSSAVCSNFFDHLIINDPDGSGTPDQVTDYRSTGKRRHRGPYLSSIDEDPFGNVFQVNVSTLKGGDRNPTWVISAGPDGDFQTAATDKKLSGDDIGIRIK